MFTPINPDSKLHVHFSKTEIRVCPDTSLGVVISDACLALVGLQILMLGRSLPLHCSSREKPNINEGAEPGSIEFHQYHATQTPLWSINTCVILLFRRQWKTASLFKC
jgi:hypothetical protein